MYHSGESNLMGDSGTRWLRIVHEACQELFSSNESLRVHMVRHVECKGAEMLCMHTFKSMKDVASMILANCATAARPSLCWYNRFLEVWISNILENNKDLDLHEVFSLQDSSSDAFEGNLLDLILQVHCKLNKACNPGKKFCYMNIEMKTQDRRKRLTYQCRNARRFLMQYRKHLESLGINPTIRKFIPKKRDPTC